MASSRVFGVPKFSAVCVGILCFGVLYALFEWMLLGHLWPWSNVTVLFLSVFLLPGFVLGLIARNSPVIHGLILGVLAPLIVPLEGILFAGAAELPPVSQILRDVVFGRGQGYWLLAGVILFPPSAIAGSYAMRKMRGR
jgi:hypothetical protein